MSNAGRAQDYLMQIVSAGYGFDVPEIQNALMKTNYKSVEAAVEYLLNADNNNDKNTNNPSSNTNTNMNTNTTNNATVSEKDIRQLKERISRLEIDGNFKMDVTDDIMNQAIKQNKNTEEALNYIMDKYTHLIKPNNETSVTNKTDVQQYKQQLIDEAHRKKQQQEKEAIEREKKLEMEKQKILHEEKEKEESRQKHRERVAANRQKISDKKKKRKVSSQKATLEWHKRHERYDKEDIVRLEEIEKNRLKQTQLIDSPDKALQMLFERYGEDDAR
eukprot:964892_1